MSAVVSSGGDTIRKCHMQWDNNNNNNKNPNHLNRIGAGTSLGSSGRPPWS